MATIFVMTSTTPTRPSIWKRFKGFVREKVTQALMSPAVGFVCCCFGTEELQMREIDNAIRREIRVSMIGHLPEMANDCVEQSMRDAAAIGYDMTNAQGRSSMSVGNLGLAVRNAQASILNPVQNVAIVPRFAASCALLLRTRLGRLPHNEANQLLVQREYLRICRMRGVRAVDIVAHQQYVANAFFGEDVLDRIALTRSRWPAWMRALCESSEFNGGPAAC